MADITYKTLKKIEIPLEEMTDKKSQGRSESFPDSKTKAYRRMERFWQVVQDLFGATRAMTEANSYPDGPYLPALAQESRAAWERRLAAAVCPRWVESTIQEMVGTAFQQEPALEEQPWAEELLQDIDGHGSDLGSFARKALQLALLRGHCFVFADSPRFDNNEVSIAEQRALNLRPFLALVDPIDVLNWSHTKIGGKQVLAHATIKEVREILEPGDFTPVEQEVYKVFRRSEGYVEYRVYQASGREFREIESGTINLPEIPLIPVYGKKIAEFESEPVFLNLAYEVQDYFGQESILRSAVEVMCFPPLQMIGWLDRSENPGSLTWGPYSAYHFDVGGGMHFAEISGEGLKVAMQRLQDIQLRAANESTALLRSDTRNRVLRTATEVSVEKASEGSKLLKIVMELEDAFRRAFDYLAVFMGQSFDPEALVFSKDLSAMVLDPQEIEARLKLFLAEAISLEELIAGLKDGGVVSEDFEPDPMTKARLVPERPDSD